MPSQTANHFADLIFHLFRYVTQQLSENNIQSVLELGFTPDDVEKISKLTLSDVRHLSSLSRHFLVDLKINHDSFDRLMKRLEEARAEESLQDELIRYGAPNGLMTELFGMNGHEYAQRRKMLCVTRVGRPSLPNDTEQEKIYSTWRRYGELDEKHRWLVVGKETGVSLTTIWPLIKSWVDSSQELAQSKRS